MSQSEPATSGEATESPTEVADAQQSPAANREELVAPTDAGRTQEQAKEEEPTVICNFCGPVKGPNAEVFQCQLCMLYFCVKHIDPFFHNDPAIRQS